MTEKHDDDLEKELLDDMRSNKFPRHRAHWLAMDPLQKWRLKWDILMMLMICFVMIVTPFDRGVPGPCCDRTPSPPSDEAVGGLIFDFERILGRISHTGSSWRLSLR